MWKWRRYFRARRNLPGASRYTACGRSPLRPWPWKFRVWRWIRRSSKRWRRGWPMKSRVPSRRTRRSTRREESDAAKRENRGDSVGGGGARRIDLLPHTAPSRDAACANASGPGARAPRSGRAADFHADGRDRERADVLGFGDAVRSACGGHHPIAAFRGPGRAREAADRRADRESSHARAANAAGRRDAAEFLHFAERRGHRGFFRRPRDGNAVGNFERVHGREFDRADARGQCAGNYASENSDPWARGSDARRTHRHFRIFRCLRGGAGDHPSASGSATYSSRKARNAVTAAASAALVDSLQFTRQTDGKTVASDK